MDRLLIAIVTVLAIGAVALVITRARRVTPRGRVFTDAAARSGDSEVVDLRGAPGRRVALPGWPADTPPLDLSAYLLVLWPGTHADMPAADIVDGADRPLGQISISSPPDVLTQGSRRILVSGAGPGFLTVPSREALLEAASRLGRD